MLQLPLFLLSLTLSVLASRQRGLEARAPANNGSSTSSTSSIAAAWYTGWHSADFPLSRVPWSKYTHLTYAFAVTTPDVNILALDASDERLLPQFVSLAQQHGVKASLSIGGWTGSRWFSTAVGSARNRTAFVNTVTNLAKRYQLDGIDFDWEYPGKQGIGCNAVSPNDTANFLSFLQELRTTTTTTTTTTTGRSLILSAAVYVTPFADATGFPSSDVSGFKDVLDYIAIMNYDLKSNPGIGAGASAPLDDTCAPAGAKWGSATSAVTAWSAAGIPKDQLVLGFPAYGHAYIIPSTVALQSGNSSRLESYPSYIPSNKRRGDRWDGDGGIDVCGVTQGPGGVYTYWGLIEEGFLKDDGAVRDGIAYRYDDCSETPFAYNGTSNVYVSFENVRSSAAKGDFIHSSGLRGFAIWEAGGDYHDVLLDSIKNATLNGNPSVRTTKPAPNQDGTQSTTASKSSAAALRFLGRDLWWRAALVFLLGVLCFNQATFTLF